MASEAPDTKPARKGHPLLIVLLILVILIASIAIAAQFGPHAKEEAAGAVAALSPLFGNLS